MEDTSMAERNKDNLRGFVVPFPFTVSDVLTGFPNTNLTTYQPIANTPTPSDDTKLFIGATGETTSTLDLQIVTSRAGVASTGEYRVRDNSLSITEEYGNNPSTMITDWAALGVQDANNQYYHNDVISDKAGGYLLVAEYKNVFSNTNNIISKQVDAFGTVTSRTVVTIESTVSGFGSSGKPALVRLPDNSVLCFVSFVNNNYSNFKAYRTTDEGSSWSLVAEQILDNEINVSTGNYAIERTSAGYSNGQIMLVISAYSSLASHTKKNHLLQYTSVDGGASFQRVTTTAQVDTNSFKSIEVFQYDNSLAVAYIASTQDLHIIVMPHAFFSIQNLREAGKFVKVNPGGSAGDFSAGTDNNMTSGWISAFKRAEGGVFVLAKDVSDDSIVATFSNDGTTFYGLLTNASPTTQPSVFFGDTTESIDMFNSCIYHGGALIVHNWTTRNTGFSLAVAYLGGFSTVSYPYREFYYSARVPIYRGQNTFGYLPIMLASASSELTASGTGSEILSAGYLQLQVNSSQTDKLFTRHKTSVIANKGVTVRAVVTVVNTDSGAAPTICELELEQSTGNYWKLKVVMQEGSFEVFDTSPLIPVSLLTQSFNCDAGFEFIMSISPAGKACFYYRNSGYDSLRQFIEGFKNTTLATVLTGSSNDIKLVFGIEGSPSTSPAAESRWSQIFTCDQAGYANISNLSTSDLVGLRFSSTSFQYINDGVSIIAKAGPTYIGDDWNIKSTSHSSIDNMFYAVSPSPNVQWKSETVSAGASLSAQRFTLGISTNSTDFGNDIVGLHLANINFKDVKLQYWDGSVWQTVFTFETSSGMKHGYTKQGRTIRQDSGNLFDHNYYFHNELKDYIAMLVSGETTEFFRVQSNTEGIFGSGTSKLCIVTLDAEPSINGTVYFIPTNVTVVCSLNGIDASKWNIELQAQKTIDNQFRIGHVYFGPLAITGTQYSKGRRITIEGGNIVTTTPDRIRYSRNLAPTQRSIQISWSDGVDQSTFYNNNADPDYFKSSSSAGSQPVAVYQDAPYMLEGILRELKGSHSPLIYLPSITTSSDNRVYNRRAEHLCGVIDSEISMTSITGEELLGDGTGEVMRVGTITILEIV